MKIRIRVGCIVTDRKGRIGVVIHAPYSVGLCSVAWERRLTHDICHNEQLTIMLTKRQASKVRKLEVPRVLVY